MQVVKISRAVCWIRKRVVEVETGRDRLETGISDVTHLLGRCCRSSSWEWAEYLPCSHLLQQRFRRCFPCSKGHFWAPRQDCSYGGCVGFPTENYHHPSKPTRALSPDNAQIRGPPPRHCAKGRVRVTLIVFVAHRPSLYASDMIHTMLHENHRSNINRS